ncbi:MAG: polyhydroxyalkanoic acid system family protein [Erythrobacter sp.]
MRVSLPHQLSREEVRRRMRAHAHEIGDFFPPGLASVTTQWPSEDRMDMTAEVLGYKIPGGVDIRDDEVIIEMQLPAILGVMRGALEKAVRKEGVRLLAP